MEGLELLENQLKQAKRVIWPNTGQEAAIKFVYELGDHVKRLYTMYESIEKELQEMQDAKKKAEGAECKAARQEAVKKSIKRESKEAKKKK